MRPAASMSMLVGFLSIGDCAQTVTSSPSGTVKMSSGTIVGGVCAEAAAAQTPSITSSVRCVAEVFMVELLERVGRDVCVDERLFALFPGLRIAVFHAEHAAVAAARDVAEEIPVVHLAGSRF